MHKSLILALAVIAAAMPIELSDVETEVKDILNEAEDLPSGLPPVHDILADVESSLPDGELLDTSNPSVQDLLLDIDSLLPTTNELEIPSTAKVAHKRGLITNIESEGSDLLNSQDIVPLEDTLSEFKSSSSASWSAWPSPTAKPSPSGKPSGDKPKGTNYLATFDDLTPVVGEVAVQEVGPYDGLDYNGIDLVTLGVEGTIVTGIVPKSSPNAGAYGLTTGLLDGLPNITTKYEGTVTESFDFHNFWFGCVKGTVESVRASLLCIPFLVLISWSRSHPSH
jgi:hypothetical protein